MQQSFIGKYFDGQSSRAHNCTLTFNKDHWVISSNEKFFETVKWSIEDIQKPEVYTGGFYSFSYGEIPKQVVEINDKSIEKAILFNYPKLDLIRKTDSFLLKNKLQSIILLASFFLVVSLFSYFVLIPQLSTSFANNLSTNSVVELGDYFYNNMEKELDINEDLTVLMQDFADEIKIESEFEMKVSVSNLDVMNAFAMPGGKIVIYRGLLEKIENENQLLALLGHEYTHTNNRHVLKNLVKNLSGYFVISLIMGDANGIISVLLENAHMLNQLTFARELEKEADIEGVEIIVDNQADPNGMSELFSIMNEEKDSVHYLIQYLSTHPEMDDRIVYTKALAEGQEIKTNTILKEKWMNLKEELYK